MRVLILSHRDVLAALPPEACAEAMAAVLAAHARGETYMPLRSVMMPPGAAGFMGLMPGWRGPAATAAPRRSRSRRSCIMPGNPARGLDAHQGLVTLFDGETGVPTAILDASAITAVRTAAVTAVATGLLARPRRADARDPRGRDAGAGPPAGARAPCASFEQVRVYAPTAAHAQALAEQAGAGRRGELSVAASAEEAVRGADVVVTATSAREPVLRRAWLKPGAHVNAVGASTPQAREIDTATVAASALFCDSRESLRHEAGEFRLAVAEGLITGERARPRRARRGAGGHCAPGRRDDGELTLFRSLGLAVEDLAAAELAVAAATERGHRHGGGAVIELAAIEAARERIAGTAIRTPLVRLHVEDAPAEIYLKLENLQPINSFKIRGATNAVMLAPRRPSGPRAWSPPARGTWPRVSPGPRATLGVPATIVVPEHAPEAKLAAIERLGGRVLKLPYDDWWNVIVTSHVDGIEGLFVHPVQDPGVMAGNGTIGLEILEDLPDPDAVVIPYGGGGLTVGIASAIKALRPGDEDRHRRAGDRRRAGRGARRRAPGRRRLPRLVRGRLRQPARAGQHVAAGRAARRRRRWPSRSARSPPPCALLAERVRVIAEGAGALAPGRRAEPAAPGPGRSSAWSPAATST